MNNYRKQQETKQKKHLNNILSELPSYVFDYFNYCEGTLDRSMETMVSYAYDVKTFYSFLKENNPLFKSVKDISIADLNKLTVRDMQEYMSYLRSYTDENGKMVTNGASARARKLSSLRSFMQYLFTFDELETNPAKLIDTPKIRKKKQSRLDRDEVKELITNTSYSNGLTERQQKFTAKASLRDTAIVTLFAGSGIRVSELVGLDLKDIDRKSSSIKVTRKGGNEDIVFVGDEVIDIIDDYIENERNQKTDTDALFLSSRGTKNQRLSVRSVERLVKKYGLTMAKDISCHTLRRSFGTEVYNKTGDIYLTANTLGHKNIQVTSEHYADIHTDKKAIIKNISNDFIK